MAVALVTAIVTIVGTAIVAPLGKEEVLHLAGYVVGKAGRGLPRWAEAVILGFGLVGIAVVLQPLSERIRQRKPKPSPRDGYIAPSDAPGFGVTLNESML